MPRPVALFVAAALAASPALAAPSDSPSLPRPEPGPWGSGFLPAGGALADLNGDGNVDMVVTYGNAGKVNLALGDGQGGFEGGGEYDGPAGIGPVAVGFRGAERRPFIAALNEKETSVLFLEWDGESTLTPAGPALPTAAGPSDLVVGYLDADRRRPFVAVLCAETPELTVIPLPETGPPTEVLSHDLRRKGKPDPKPVALAAADLDEDGRLDDLAVANSNYAQVGLLFGEGPGIFEWRFKDGNVDRSPCDIAALPFGGAGEPLLAVAHAFVPFITLHVRDDEKRYGFRELARIRSGRGVRAVDMVSTGDPPVTLVASASKYGEGSVRAWLVEWDGTIHRIGTFDGDNGLHQVLAGCLSGTDHPFLIGLGRRIHPVPLHLTGDPPR